MKAFHNDAAIKEKYLFRVETHRKADELVKGVSWENGKGCAIGCTLEAYNHAAYETELGIPEILSRLEDCIFEGLPNGKFQKWPERFLSAVNVGADLSRVGPKFLLAIIQRRYDCLGKKDRSLVGDAIMQVISVLEKWIETGKADKSAAWSAARSAASAAWSAAWSAESAAWSAARSAASAAWSAARSAASAAWSAARSAESAESAAWSAASAAWSAARSAESAESAAWSAEYIWMADTLIELISKENVK